MHGDVVEFAKAFLQLLQGRQKGQAALLLLFPGKHRFVEFGRIAQFLGPDAQLVPRARIELRQPPAAFADLLPAPLELRAGHGLDPLLAAVASELAARLAPTAGFDPPGDISVSSRNRRDETAASARATAASR